MHGESRLKQEIRFHSRILVRKLVENPTQEDYLLVETAMSLGAKIALQNFTPHISNSQVINQTPTSIPIMSKV